LRILFHSGFVRNTALFFLQENSPLGKQKPGISFNGTSSIAPNLVSNTAHFF
jgi:hypothetical protein